MHRTTMAAAGLLTAALAITSCSSGSDAATPTPTTSSPVPTVALRDQFLQATTTANIESWARDHPGDDELAAYPVEWCTQLAYGHSAEWMFSNEGGLYPIGMDWGTTKADAYRVLVLAVGFYCPEEKERVTAEARAAGGY